MWTVKLNFKFYLLVINLNLKQPYVAHGDNIGHCRYKLFQKFFFVILSDNLHKCCYLTFFLIKLK